MRPAAVFLPRLEDPDVNETLNELTFAFSPRLRRLSDGCEFQKLNFDSAPRTPGEGRKRVREER